MKRLPAGPHSSPRLLLRPHALPAVLSALTLFASLADRGLTLSPPPRRLECSRCWWARLRQSALSPPSLRQPTPRQSQKTLPLDS
eukprot:3059856-Rhodomonas_salina.1